MGNRRCGVPTLEEAGAGAEVEEVAVAESPGA